MSTDLFISAPSTTHHGDIPYRLGFCRFAIDIQGLSLADNVASCRDRARRIDRPAYRSMRPSRCSKSTGLLGKSQWTMWLHHTWKSNPSCPMEVVTSTCGLK